MHRTPEIFPIQTPIPAPARSKSDGGTPLSTSSATSPLNSAYSTSTSTPPHPFAMMNPSSHHRKRKCRRSGQEEDALSDKAELDGEEDVEDDADEMQLPAKSIGAMDLRFGAKFGLDAASSPPADEERRAHHNELERRRRDHIKDHFTALKNSIPLLEGEKSSRALILKRAVDYIGLLQSQVKEYRLQVEELRKQNELLAASSLPKSVMPLTEAYVSTTSLCVDNRQQHRQLLSPHILIPAHNSVQARLSPLLPPCHTAAMIGQPFSTPSALKANAMLAEDIVTTQVGGLLSSLLINSRQLPAIGGVSRQSAQQQASTLFSPLAERYTSHEAIVPDQPLYSFAPAVTSSFPSSRTNEVTTRVANESELFIGSLLLKDNQAAAEVIPPPPMNNIPNMPPASTLSVSLPCTTSASFHPVV